MAKEYTDDDILMLSGIQHYAFCPRQWALIYIDQQWDENRRIITLGRDTSVDVEGTLIL